MATGVTLVKSFDYRTNAVEEFSNTYWVSKDTPVDRAGWSGLVNTIAGLEKHVFPSTVAYQRAYCYDDDSGDPGVHAVQVFTKGEIAGGNIVGDLVITGAEACPGDAAAVVWWKTARVTSKGKAIYLRKFIHPAFRAATPTDPDALFTGQITALETFATAMRASGSPVWTIVGPGHDDDEIILSGASPWVTTRTLKRRGKRPGS